MRACRLLIEPSPQDGAWNMAVDEALLESAVAATEASGSAPPRSVVTVRLYQWEQPTLSLGYFQSPSGALDDSRWRGLPVVRRLSGGGAILHDRELTYSVTIPPGHPDAANPRRSYDRVHHVFIRALAEFGISTRLRGVRKTAVNNEFLCFSRGDEFDVICGDFKIVGSAQRRRKGAVLQHGSLILRRSPLAPQIPGLLDLVAIELPTNLLVTSLAKGLAGLFGDVSTEGRLTSDEQALAERLRDVHHSRRLD